MGFLFYKRDSRFAIYHEFAINESITFTLNTDSTPNCNSVWIYYPDGSSKSYANVGTSLDVKIDTSGNYEALVQAWNSIGAKSGERIKFHVGSPTYANIQLHKTEFDINETISFYLDTDGTPNCNCVWVYYPDGSTKTYTDIGDSLELKIDTPGNYEALVQAWNSIGAKSSNRVNFSVNKPKSYIDARVKKTNNTYSVDVIPHNIEYSNDIIVASYMNGQLVTFERREYLEDISNFTVNGDIDEIKVMVWNSLSGLMPLCEAEVIPSSEFIAE